MEKKRDILLSFVVALVLVGLGILGMWAFVNYNDVMVVVLTALGMVLLFAMLVSLIYGWVWLIKRY